METPLSARRATRSQKLAALSNSANNTPMRMEDSDKGLSKSRPKTKNQDRSALIDITNDSPIVGLASGSLETPVSSIAKRRSKRCKRTPSSGEALLRGQVKTLLQRVEEEAEISKFCLEFCGPTRNGLKAFPNSPAGFLAPTPVNTPQVSSIDEFRSFDSASKSPIEDQLKISQGENSITVSEKDLKSGSLFLDFLERSDSSSDCSSVVTCQGTEVPVEKGKGKSSVTEDDDDHASMWSFQVNASTRDEVEEEDEMIEDGVEEEDYGEEGDKLLFHELCEGMSKIAFEGKHTRFEYNSEDELVEFSAADDSDKVLTLRGLPTPKGKHLRFQDDEEE